MAVTMNLEPITAAAPLLAALSVQQACLISPVATAAPNYENISPRNTERLTCKPHLRPSIHRVKTDPF